jgi:hypothetical protein
MARLKRSGDVSLGNCEAAMENQQRQTDYAESKNSCRQRSE